MPCDEGSTSMRRIPSLVQQCQRVLSTHANGICGLAQDLRWDLIEPVLKSCSAETLLRIEQASPHVESDISGIWKKLCFDTYSRAVLQMRRLEEDEEPESWRAEYFVLRDLETKRLEEVGTRLRMQRLEAEERKRESGVKTIDRVPPAKRPRWGGPSQPKTLMQKTREEAARMQKGLFGARFRPPPKVHRLTANHDRTNASAPPSSSSNTLASSAHSSGSRVTVTTVTVRRSSTAPPNRLASGSVPLRLTTSPPAVVSSDARLRSPSTVRNPLTTPDVQTASRPPEPQLLHTKQVPLAKKAPTSTLFMPKQRARSQLPIQYSASRGIRS